MHSTRKAVGDMLAAGQLPPVPGATTLEEYQDAIVAKAREAHAAAPPDVQAAHPLDIPYLMHMAAKLYRHHAGQGSLG